MDIEEFIEQDILIFLDERLDRKYDEQTSRQSLKVESVYLSRDYEEELYSALERDSVTAAKHVLHDLREKFEEIPASSPDKQQVKALLAHLYDLFRRHISGNKFERPETTEKSLEEPPAPKPQVIPEPDTSTIVRLLDQAELLAGQGNFKQAIQNYRKAKTEVVSLPSVPFDLAGRFKDTFARIQELLKDSKSRSHETPVEETSAEVKSQTPEIPKPPEQKIPTEKPKENIKDWDHHIILQLENEKHKMDKQLREHKIGDAMKTYQDMKVLVQQIKDHQKAERMAEKLVKIYGLIKKIKNSPMRTP